MLEHLATWTEVSTTMSIDDVMDLCDSADAYFDAMHGDAGGPKSPPKTPSAPRRVPRR